MATFPLATLAATITPTGISAPTYSEIYQSLQESFKEIYGPDSYINPDSQDGQLLAIFAKAIADCNDTAIKVYNDFSPVSAQGAGLSSLVRLSGITRLSPSNSQVDVEIVGVVGTTIVNGKVAGPDGNQWSLPAEVTIPSAGFIIVTALCDTEGAIEAQVGSINQIVTPTLGWQSVTNPTIASAGAPVETDAALRLRQQQSVAQPSRTVLFGILGAVKAVAGVTEAVIYENDTGAVDSNGLPAHSIAVVVLGGDAEEIATAIMLRKTPGAFTYGNVTIPVADDAGIIHNISFFVPTLVQIRASLQIEALVGYSGTTGNAIKQAIADYINALPIGQDVVIARLYLPAQLNGGPGSEQFDLQSLLISVVPNPPTNIDVTIPFNSSAACNLADITLTVV
jgi:uncharacterized phage protein gp47/JayE